MKKLTVAFISFSFINAICQDSTKKDKGHFYINDEYDSRMGLQIKTVHGNRNPE